MSELKLLSEPTNFAVVYLPGRAFPGVVFQGDILDSLISEIVEATIQNDPDAKAEILNEVLERLRGVRLHYEAVLGREGIALPYSRA